MRYAVLREKLNDEYSLAPQPKPKKKQENSKSVLLNSSQEVKQEIPEGV